ncbi:hypothetical protein GF337_18065 [candidate division KSB1 bacterium]|nr:hypothetical protein [candidate division KSB1 bacterium]
MTRNRISARFTWIYFILGVFCLITAGVHIERAALIAIAPSFFLRGFFYALLGIFWMVLFGNSKKNAGSQEKEEL